MVDCPKCGDVLIRTPILTSEEMREYKEAYYYPCFKCGVTIYEDN